MESVIFQFEVEDVRNNVLVSGMRDFELFHLRLQVSKMHYF